MWNFKISFLKSKSQGYKPALGAIRRIPGSLSISDEDGSASLLIDQENFLKRRRQISNLIEKIEGWKGSEISVNGKVIDRKSANRLSEIGRCADQCSKSGNIDSFCSGKKGYQLPPFGCVQLRSLNDSKKDSHFAYWEYEKSKYWFQHGAFISPGVWQVDKQRLLDILSEEAHEIAASLCPFFSSDRINAILEKRPTTIDTTTDTTWSVCYGFEESEIKSNQAANSPICVIPTLQLKLLEDSDRSSLTLDFGLENDDEEKTDDDPTKRLIPEVSFSDIARIDSILEQIRLVIELPLKQPELIKRFQIKPHKGVLLFGPPGCGKTLIAQAIANECQAHFIHVRGPELLNKYVGQSEKNLRNLFDQAREKSPSVVFFDEFDSVGMARNDTESGRLLSGTVNQLLSILDGVESLTGVIVIASTNRPDLLDKALLRPGRFDYKLEIPFPDKTACAKILQIHLKNVPLDKSVNLDVFGEQLFGLSGAQIAFVAREASYNCLRRTVNMEKALSGEICNEIGQVNANDLQAAFAKLKVQNQFPEE